MKTPFRRAIACAIPLAFTLALSFAARAVEPNEMLPDPALESRARAVSQALRCVVCQNETIDESHAELARDMRLLVRRRISEGDSNDQVLQYMVQRYGDFVLLQPRFTAATVVLWLGPFLILLIGGIALRSRLRRRIETPAGLSPAERAALAALDADTPTPTPGATRPMIWLLFAVMALAAVTALLWPLLRTPTATADRAAYDMTVFRDQLDEVDRDVARGVLTALEADAARVEIQRRLLGAARDPAKPVQSEGPQIRALVTAAVAVAVPFLALGLYLTVGAPQLTGAVVKKAQTAATAEHDDSEVNGLVEKLAARMRETPDNAEGWSLLARTYRQMEKFAEAAAAYRNVMRLQPDDAEGFSSFGEVATAAAGGTVPEEARAAFIRALQIDRGEPRARFYLGLAVAQTGDAKNAIAIWRELTASAPADAPWLGMVRNQMGAVAQDAGIMPMSVEPRPALDVIGGAAPKVAVPPSTPDYPTPDQPTSPDVGALKDRFSPENLEMIQGMVGGLAGRLEANPDDYNGWLLLGRSYTVLKNIKGAKEAYGRAATLKPQEIAPKVQLADLMLQESNLDKPVNADLVRVAGDIKALDGEQPLALFVLGLAKAQSGDAAGARALWTSAQSGLPAEAPLRKDIARRLAALK